MEKVPRRQPTLDLEFELYQALSPSNVIIAMLALNRRYGKMVQSSRGIYLHELNKRITETHPNPVTEVAMLGPHPYLESPRLEEGLNDLHSWGLLGFTAPSFRSRWQGSGSPEEYFEKWVKKDLRNHPDYIEHLKEMARNLP